MCHQRILPCEHIGRTTGRWHKVEAGQAIGHKLSRSRNISLYPGTAKELHITTWNTVDTFNTDKKGLGLSPSSTSLLSYWCFRMDERERTKLSAFSAPSWSPNLESFARKKKRSSSASPPRRNNKIFNNIVTEQPRVQMKHYQLESLWRKLASEVGDETAGLKLQPHSHWDYLSKLWETSV